MMSGKAHLLTGAAASSCRLAVDADALNQTIQHQFATLEKEARACMLAFMQENDTHLPALCCLPGVRPLSTIRLAAFTRDRLFRTLAATSRSPVHEKDSCDSFQVPAADVAAVEMLFNIIEGEAPGSMNLREIVQLMGVSQYYLADEIQHNMPAYIAPALQQASARELAWLLPHALQQLRDRCDMRDTFVSIASRCMASPGIATSSKSFSSFAQGLLQTLACMPHGDIAQQAMLSAVVHSDSIPSHGRMLFAIAAAASACAAGGTDQLEAVWTDLEHAFLQVCGSACPHADVLSDLLLDACTAASDSGACSAKSSAAAASMQRTLLKRAQRLLLQSHCSGPTCQRLRLSPAGQPSVLGKTKEREMFVARLALPSSEQRCSHTCATASGWWLKIERSAPCSAAEDTTYSLFLNNSNASAAAPLQAAFEVGILANSTPAMQKAEAQAVLIDHSGFMRPGLWAPHEAAIHRSAIRQEFSGQASWGIRHLCDEIALARLGYGSASNCTVCVFGMVQTS